MKKTVNICDWCKEQLAGYKCKNCKKYLCIGCTRLTGSSYPSFNSSENPKHQEILCCGSCLKKYAGLIKLKKI